MISQTAWQHYTEHTPGAEAQVHYTIQVAQYDFIMELKQPLRQSQFQVSDKSSASCKL